MNNFSLDSLPTLSTDETLEPKLSLFLGRVRDFWDDLHPEEQQQLTSQLRSRRDEYSSGRRLAKIALAHFGVAQAPVLRDGRRPIWPPEVWGSISHSAHMAACVMCRRRDYTGIGVDIAPLTALNRDVSHRILDTDELQWIEKFRNHEWWTACFTAKEAIYKSVNEATGEFLGFRDVHLKLQPEDQSFTAETVGGKKSAALVTRGRGHFHRIEGHWLTTFVVDP